MSSLKSVIIITGSTSSIKSVSSIVRQSSTAQWLYCGKDVPFSLELDIELDRITKIDIGKSLQEIAREFRQDYIDFIGQISQSIAGDSSIDCWWLSSISEKNPFISNVFLYFCYVKLSQRILETIPGDLIIISESHDLSRTLFDYLTSLNRYKVSLANGGKDSPSERIRSNLRPVIKKAWFFASFFSRITFARIFRLLAGMRGIRPRGPPAICIHSFTDDRSLTDPDHYQHIYFRGLGPELERAGMPYSYLIDVLPTSSYISVIFRLLRYPESCYFLEEYIGLSDLVKTERFVAGSGNWWDSGVSMGGVLMRQILHGELLRDRANTRRQEAYLRYCAGKRISSQTQLQRFVYIFENHIWEKMFCRAFRCFSPGTTLVGYAHSIVNTMYTSYTVSEYEQDLLPLPDVIAVNGIRAKNVLEQSGFTGKKIAIVGALRYQHLVKKKFSGKGQKKKIVLVALSAGLNDSLELTQKVISALGNRKGFSIDLKCHPTLPFSIISRHIRTLPSNVCIRMDPIERLLANSDVLLYAESTVCVEALAMGVPVVNVRSDHRIDMNIFEGIESIPSVSSQTEILDAVTQVISADAREQFNHLQVIVDEFFAPLSTDFLEVFVGMNEPP
jgi:glycosyltransferase involved in cell wall biosynthesis